MDIKKDRNGDWEFTLNENKHNEISVTNNFSFKSVDIPVDDIRTTNKNLLFVNAGNDRFSITYEQFLELAAAVEVIMQSYEAGKWIIDD